MRILDNLLGDWISAEQTAEYNDLESQYHLKMMSLHDSALLNVTIHVVASDASAQTVTLQDHRVHVRAQSSHRDSMIMTQIIDFCRAKHAATHEFGCALERRHIQTDTGKSTNLQSNEWQIATDHASNYMPGESQYQVLRGRLA